MKEKEEQRLINLKQYECELRSKGYKYICGIDEAGSPTGGCIRVGISSVQQSSAAPSAYGQFACQWKCR